MIELNVLSDKPVVPAAKGVEKSANRKIGKISATMISQASCPKSCPFFLKGCYAKYGFLGMFVTSKLNKAPETRAYKIALEEAKAILGLTGKNPLRLHVVGDSKTTQAVRIVAAASAEYTSRFNQAVYTYTHCWEWTKRISWGNISVLASCETKKQLIKANKRGYGSALVVNQFEKDTAYDIGDGFTLIPCPAQTKENVTCKTCKLCTKDKFLWQNKRVIGFAKHGTAKASMSDILDY